MVEIIFPAGYGNFAAETFGGRIFCLLFGIIGIPLMLTVLVDVSGLIAEGWRWHGAATRTRSSGLRRS